MGMRGFSGSCGVGASPFSVDLLTALLTSTWSTRKSELIFGIDSRSESTTYSARVMIQRGGRAPPSLPSSPPTRARSLMFGYHGRYLRIDLTAGTATAVPLPQDVLRRFLGGVGLAAYLMHREAPPGVDPLGPAAPLIFSLSPLVGTPLTTSAKFAVVAKSPLTDRLNDALSSSHCALSAKKAGCDAIVIGGACSCPSILIIADGPVSIGPGQALWWLPADGAEARLAQRRGPNFSSAVHGPARGS